MRRKRIVFTARDWRIIHSAVAHLSAGEIDELVDADIEMEHIELVLDKISERRSQL